MANSGTRASFTWNTTAFTSANCIQSWDLASSINDIVYQCNGYDKHAAGTKAVSFRTSIGLNSTDVALIQGFAPGTTAAWEAHPGGDTTTYIEVTATRGLIISAPISAPVNGIITVDLDIALDDISYTCAA